MLQGDSDREIVPASLSSIWENTSREPPLQRGVMDVEVDTGQASPSHFTSKHMTSRRKVRDVYWGTNNHQREESEKQSREERAEPRETIEVGKGAGQRNDDVSAKSTPLSSKFLSTSWSRRGWPMELWLWGRGRAHV